jgi:hypothetical protein
MRMDEMERCYRRVAEGLEAELKSLMEGKASAPPAKKQVGFDNATQSEREDEPQRTEHAPRGRNLSATAPERT